MTRVLVTGAAGFIGHHLVEALYRVVPDAVVIGLDRDPDMPTCDRRVVCDLASVEVFQTVPALPPLDYVINLAAQSFVHYSLARPDIYVRDNVLATSNLIQTMAAHPSLKRFLQVSSCEVYGDAQSPSVETDQPKPRTPYAATKLAQEHLALSAIEHQMLPTVVCRLFNNYGRGQQGNRLIPRAMQAVEADRNFIMTGDGNQRRDWIAVEDTCEALLAAMLEPAIARGDLLNVSSEQVYSVLQVVEMCEAATGRSILVNQSTKDAGHLQLSAGDASKIRNMTGWRPTRNLPDFIASIGREFQSSGG